MRLDPIIEHPPRFVSNATKPSAKASFMLIWTQRPKITTVANALMKWRHSRRTAVLVGLLPS